MIHPPPPALRATPSRKGRGDAHLLTLAPCGRGCPEGAGEGCQK